MPRITATNSLTDVSGLLVGHYTDFQAMSGVTVIICPEGAAAGVDVRGSAPGTRETDLLDPVNLIEKVQAVVLSGGSVYGLANCDPVVGWLAERGYGFPLDENHVAPIVPAAVLYDLGRGERFIPAINRSWGLEACQQASSDPVPSGCLGAGTGALAGSIKGGLGSAGQVLDSGLTVTALIAVNSNGSVINPETGLPWEIGLEEDGEFGSQGRRRVCLPEAPESSPGRNTTIGVVATNAVLSKAQATKVAQMAQDGLARSIRPAHTMFDGDAIFCLATGEKPLADEEGFFQVKEAQAVNELGQAAADCTSRAIIQGVLSAQSLAGIAAFCDLAEKG
ncbi:MAG: P1 family peptidase [Desulfohalobiaceae bacterium]|nr:P1 family peptidase [Desulfohalobiaceae bacterium]